MDNCWELMKDEVPKSNYPFIVANLMT